MCFWSCQKIWIPVEKKMPEEQNVVFVFSKYMNSNKHHNNITMASWGKYRCFECNSKKVFDKATKSYYFEPTMCTDHEQILWHCKITGNRVNPSHWMSMIPTPYPEPTYIKVE